MQLNLDKTNGFSALLALQAHDNDLNVNVERM